MLLGRGRTHLQSAGNMRFEAMALTPRVRGMLFRASSVVHIEVGTSRHVTACREPHVRPCPPSVTAASYFICQNSIYVAERLVGGCKVRPPATLS